jgi:hypothetical protein
MIAEVPLLDDGVAPMAVRALNLAGCDLSLEDGNRALTAGELHHSGRFFTDVMEIQDDRVGLTARDARMLAQVVE